MKTLRKLKIRGGLLLAGTGVPAAVGDQVTMYLDVDANPDFPDSIVGVIQHPVVIVDCGSSVEYSVEYDEADLTGALLLRPQDVVDTVLVTQGDILDELKAPKASPTFTGTVTLGDGVNVVVNATTGSKFGTATTQKIGFHNATPVIQRASASQAVVTATVGAAVVTTASALTSYGYTQAQADSLVARVNSLIVDNAAQTVLVNELRAALVEKGIIKGSI